MALVTVQRSPSPSNSPESEDAADGSEEEDASSPPSRSRRTGMQKLRKCYNTISFIRKLRLSESYLAVKGAALILPQSECHRRVTKGAQCGDIQHHLQSMFYLLRPQDTIKIAVKLESRVSKARYMVIVSCIGRQDTEECIILGVDINDESTIGLVFPIWNDMGIRLDGDGGFIISSLDRNLIFKPVSVQAMWSALQCLHKVNDISRTHYYFPGGLTHTWVSYYQCKITSLRDSINEWEAMDDLLVPRAEKISFLDDDAASLEAKIRTKLKEIMMQVDLEEVTSRYLRLEVEKALGMNLKEYRWFIDKESMTILGQLDKPSPILDYLYLGSEWNASNLEELQKNGVGYILNVTREIDNFFPGMFNYMNIRVMDNLQADLLKYWEKTYKFIKEAQMAGSKCLVHCKMGISRSASTVIAYLMKDYQWDYNKSLEFTENIRSCINPNDSFRAQLRTYEGILDASNQRHNELWQSGGPPSSPSSAARGMMTSSGDGDVSRPLYWNPDQDDMDPDDIDMTNTQGTLKLITEEILASKYGAPPPNPFTFDEVELSSRSADSVEECFPDLPTPMEYECDSVRLVLYRQLSDQIAEPLMTASLSVADSEVAAASSSSDSSELTAAFYNCLRAHDYKQREIFKMNPLPMYFPTPTVAPKARCKSESATAQEKDPFCYEKEDIPWNVGTVLKTKLDFESRIQQQSRDRHSSSSSDDVSANSSVDECQDQGRITVKVPSDHNRREVPVLDIGGQDLLTESCTDDVITDDQQTGTGLVKRTTLEIEHRERVTKSPQPSRKSLDKSSTPPSTPLDVEPSQSIGSVSSEYEQSPLSGGNRKPTPSPEISPLVSRRKKAKMSGASSSRADESFEVFHIGDEEVVVKKGKVKRHTLDFEQLKSTDIEGENAKAGEEVQVETESEVPPKGMVALQKEAFENRKSDSATNSPCYSPLSSSPKQKESHMESAASAMLTMAHMSTSVSSTQVSSISALGHVASSTQSSDTSSALCGTRISALGDTEISTPNNENNSAVICVGSECIEEHELPSAGIVRLHKDAIEARKRDDNTDSTSTVDKPPPDTVIKAKTTEPKCETVILPTDGTTTITTTVTTSDEVVTLRPTRLEDDPVLRRHTAPPDAASACVEKRPVRQVKSLVCKFEQQSPTDELRPVMEGEDFPEAKSVSAPSSPQKSSRRRRSGRLESGDSLGDLPPAVKAEESRKTRKSHGRTHPLEHLTKEQTLSRNPFYSTM